MVLNFDQYAADGNQFLNQLSTELGYPEDRDRAGRVLRTVLHVVRDMLPPEESVQFLAQLPMFLKAVFVEEWSLKHHKRVKTYEDFVHKVRKEDRFTSQKDFEKDDDIEKAVAIVFLVLRKYVSLGELEDIKASFPKELKPIMNSVLMV